MAWASLLLHRKTAKEGDALGEVRLGVDQFAHHRAYHHVWDETSVF